MKKLFGTDGIRGKANHYPITAEMALMVGKAVAHYFKKHYKGDEFPKAVIGKDTRLSGYMLETAITSGLLSEGMDVLAVGPMPTPAVAHLTCSMGAVCGIMITASHNVACDNGIKIFASDGIKLDDDVEKEIEDYIFAEDKEIYTGNIGKAYRIDDARGRYISFAKSSIKNFSLRGLKVVLDCANGAAYSLAPLILKELGAKVIEIAVKPDGYNINDKCGALFIDNLSKEVLIHDADVGIALDGDADRVIFCDEKGNEINGDKVLGMFAIDYKKRNKLSNDSIVITSMSNLGLHEAMRKHGINVEITDVGDRYVIERMRQGDFNIGGEQSGHIIFMDYVTTGDGIISALHLLKFLKKSEKKLSILSEFMRVFPQKLISLNVQEKRPLNTLSIVNEKIAEAKVHFQESGRIILRYSGTENKIRVLVEATDENDVEFWTNEIVNAIKLELGE